MKKQELIDIIDSFNHPTNSDFPNDKLAYFSLTKKVELELRDAIAYQIHRKLPTDEFVCREWNYIDVAVVDINNNPNLLIEYKSHNSVDFPNFLVKKGESCLMAKDILKLKHHAQKNNADLYFIFFNNVTKSSFPLPADPNGQAIFAYRPLVNRLIHLSYKEKVLIVFKNWVDLLRKLNLPLGLTTAVEINAGIYRGIELSVIAFVYGPFKEGDVYTIPGETFKGSDLDSVNIKKNDLDEITFIYHDETLKDILTDLRKYIQLSGKGTNKDNLIKKMEEVQDEEEIGTQTIEYFRVDKNFVFKEGIGVRIHPKPSRKDTSIFTGRISRIFRHRKQHGVKKIGDEEATIEVIPSNQRPKKYYYVDFEEIELLTKDEMDALGLE